MVKRATVGSHQYAAEKNPIPASAITIESSQNDLRLSSAPIADRAIAIWKVVTESAAV